ncbi:MAG TPA: Pvc16 family protein [Opitutaceae bacterium]|nr:Pvc16 family protein [Opitutaceae bacterium]
MPLLDLSLVTQTWQNVIQRRVRAGLTALGLPNPVIAQLLVSTLPPDQLSGEVTLGFYLYHAAESSALKNIPPPSQDTPAVRFTPMGLDLFYQLSAHSSIAGDGGVYMTHRLFGLAMKALRDFPSVNRNIEVEGSSPFPSELDGTENLFRISLQAVPSTEASQFWTAGTQSVRLSAYYQVAATLLEPEPPSRYSGRVLRYGVHTFVSGAPRLDASRSLVVYRLPGETTNREATIQPAEAPVGGQLTFHGTDLSGDETTLLIKHARFAEPIEVGLEWGVSATTDRIFATVQPLADTEAMLPGFYTAMASVTRRKRMPDGNLRDFTGTSNEVTFAVAPLITSPDAVTVATADATGVVVVQGHLFRHAALANEDLRVVVGAGELPRETTGALQAGHFEVMDGSTLPLPFALDDATRPFVIRFQFPIAGVNSGDVVPLRIRINGAENAPRWVEAP